MAFFGPDDELPPGLVPPGAADSAMRQVAAMCWMDLPKEDRSLDALEAEMRRLLERVVANMREDEDRKKRRRSP